MAGKLTNFLSELAVSPEKLASYQQNPDAAMKEAGLDADECAALKSGDPAKVYASLSGQSASGGQPNCIWAAAPQANCIWQPQPQANCIWSAQPQANCIWSAQPQPNCIWAAQPQPNCIWATQPQAHCIWSAQPQAGANCIWAAQPQPNCIWATQPQAATLWAAQPCTIVVHHFIHNAPPEPNQPGSQSPKADGTTGTTS